jgi:hypothetical protein
MAAAALALAFDAGAAMAETDPVQDKADCDKPPSPREGIAACTRVLRAGAAGNVDRAVTLNNRAWQYHLLGMAAPGLRDANEALRLHPDFAAAYDTRGHLHRIAGNRNAAIADFNRALGLATNTATAESARDGLRRLGAAPPQPAPGTPVNFTWRFRNNSGSTVHVKMYARERRNWWPGANTNWRMDSVGPYSFTISCRYGEKVCYGAWQAGNTERYWGTGFQDQHGCESCCYACKEGQTTLYNLNR